MGLYKHPEKDGAAVGFRFKCKVLTTTPPADKSNMLFELSLNEKVVPLHANMTETEVAEAIKKSRAIRVKNGYTSSDGALSDKTDAYDLFVAFKSPTSTKSSATVCSTNGTIVDIRFPAFYCKEDLLVTMDFNPAEIEISNRKKGYFESAKTGNEGKFKGFNNTVTSDKKDPNDDGIEPQELAIQYRKRCYECSNNGYCDVSRRGCKCSGGYRSSNGIGGSGRKGDCGHDDIMANMK